LYLKSSIANLQQTLSVNKEDVGTTDEMEVVKDEILTLRKEMD